MRKLILGVSLSIMMSTHLAVALTELDFDRSALGPPVFMPAPSPFLACIPGNVLVDTFGVVNFSNNASATNTNIGITNSSLVSFNDSSTADNAIIFIDNTSTLNFDGSSTAGFAQITVDGTLSFGNSSQGGNSSIFAAAGSATNFFNNSSGGSATYSSVGASLNYFNNSTAEQMTVNATAGTAVVFSDNSLGGNSTLNITNSSLVFSGNSNAQEATINMNNSPLTFAGASSGGNSAVTLGNNGSMVIDHSLSIGSLAGDVTSSVALGSNILTIGSNNQSTVFAGMLSSSPGGKFIKIGTGSFTLTGDNSGYLGPVFIELQTFFLENIVGGDVTVANGGILSGSGTVGGNLLVMDGGTVAPTPGISTLHVNGTFVQEPGGTYQVFYNGAGQSTLLDIDGTATLGGRVLALSTDGSYSTVTRYRILHADGGVLGTFESGLSANPMLRLILTYDDNNAYLSLVQNIMGAGVTPNQRAVAAQLDSVNNPTGDIATVINALLTLPAEQAAGALDEMAGEQYTYSFLTTEHADRRFGVRVYNAFRNALYPCNTSPVCTTVEAWGSYSGGRSFADGDINAKGYKSTTSDVSAGLHKYFNNHLLIGVAADYEEDKIHFNQGGCNAFRTGQGSLYAAYRAPQYYVFSNVIIGSTWSKFNRPISFGTISRKAHSKPKINHTTFYSEIGKDYEYCNVLFQPFLGFDIGCYKRNHIVEHGAASLNLEIKKQTARIGDSYLGTHLTTFYGNAVVLNADIAWQHRFAADRTTETTEFRTFGKPFTIKGSKEGKDGIRGAINIAADVTKQLQFYGQFAGERWSHWSSYGFTVGVNSWW